MTAAPATACLLTPPGMGGIAVISLRGPRAAEIVAKLFRPLRSHAEGGEGRLQLGRLVDGGRVLDEAVVQSRGDWAEINIHGGPAVARGVLEAMLRAGATIEIQPASPRDSVCNEVAALRLPVGARTEPTTPTPVPHGLPAAHPRWNNPAVGEEMLQALPRAASATVVSAVTRQWSAGISELARGILMELESCPESRPIAMGRSCENVGRASHTAPYGYLPAGPPRSTRESRAGMPDLRTAAAARLRQAAGGLNAMRRILEPAEVVLAGPPNAGKSTLANALVGRAVSIVHQTPGTTRDWVRELALLAGIPVWITDTAGLWRGMDVSPMCVAGILVAAATVSPSRPEGILRGEGVSPLRPEGILPSAASSVSSSSSSSAAAAAPVEPRAPLHDVIDRESERRALDRIGRADLVLLLGQPPAAGPAATNGRPNVIRVWTKADACPPPSGEMDDRPCFSSEEIGDCPYFSVSARTGQGMDHLREAILRSLDLADFDPTLPRAFTARQATLLLAAADSLGRDDARQAASSLRRLLEG